jgi:hypothetical protein
MDGHSNKGQSNTMDKHLESWNIKVLEQSTLDTQSIQTQHPLKHLDNHGPQNNILKLLNEI